MAAASGADIDIRMGDSAGSNKVSFEDYSDTEVAAIDSDGNLTLDGTVDGIDIATDVGANTTHRGDNSQAHTDYLINSAEDTGVGLILTQENDSVDTQFTPQVLYNTDGTPPAAGGFPVGTIYVQYTA